MTLMNIITTAQGKNYLTSHSQYKLLQSQLNTFQLYFTEYGGMQKYLQYYTDRVRKLTIQQLSSSN